MILIFLFMVFSFFQSVSADQALSEYAERILSSSGYQSSPSIIGEREWKELQLDRLVTILDRTKTSFGRWGLVQLLHPIADEKQLKKRKEIITFLIDNPKKMSAFQKQLERVRGTEKSLLAYWDKHDQLNRAVERFYFSSLFGLAALNKNAAALNVSTASEMFYSIQSFLITIALGGVAAEFSEWVYGSQEDVDLLRGLNKGIKAPWIQHLPLKYQLKDSQGPYAPKDYARAFWGQGSWGDRYAVMSQGYGTIESGVSTMVAGSNAIWSALWATAPTLMYDYNLINAVDATGRKIIAMNRDLNQLQVRVSEVANCIKGIMNLRTIIASQDDEFSAYFNADENDERVEVFLKKLLTPRFLQKSGYVYSRGHVLAMHQDIMRVKKSLIPLMHSIALLDAYCSIAQLYNESQTEPVKFSFPEFVDSPKPFMHYYNAWLPLLSYNQAIANNLLIGGDQPGKFIITGPNGGGKSTVLKEFGVAGVLAQSWCVVPAENAKQTLLASIRTGLAPQEDLEKGLSTFMAEKKTMTELLNDIRASDDSSILVLIDEPYKGTVDDESAKRIYQFGMDIAGYSQALVGIATHVKKPILLEGDTGGIFTNYQVQIRECSYGVFERLFKLEKGPARWWFEDDNQRSRFIDWISAKSTVSY